MKTQNTPTTRLMSAYRAKRVAQENCAHWDYEGNIADGECCRALLTAREEVRRARQVAKEAGEIE